MFQWNILLPSSGLMIDNTAYIHIRQASKGRINVINKLCINLQFLIMFNPLILFICVVQPPGTSELQFFL